MTHITNILATYLLLAYQLVIQTKHVKLPLAAYSRGSSGSIVLIIIIINPMFELLPMAAIFPTPNYLVNNKWFGSNLPLVVYDILASC